MNMFDERKIKKCKYCGAEMQQMISKCPNCKQEQNPGLNIIGIIIVVIVLIGMIIKFSS